MFCRPQVRGKVFQISYKVPPDSTNATGPRGPKTTRVSTSLQSTGQETSESRLTLDLGTLKRPAQSRDFLPIRGSTAEQEGNLTYSGSSQRRAQPPCIGSAACRRPTALWQPVLASQSPGGWSCPTSRAASSCLLCRSNLPGCGIHTLSWLTRTIPPRSPSSQRSREYPFTEHSPNDTQRVKPQAVLMLSSLLQGRRDARSQ